MVIRFPSVASSDRLLQMKKEPAKKRSSDQYGTIIAGTNGIRRSQP
jgi:hypothetical protein